MSGSDLYIDGAMLARVRSNLSGIRDLMEQPAREMQDVTGSAMGASALARRMDEFGDEWSYGISKLSEFAGSAVEALDRIAEAFQAADTALAEALEQAAEQ
ncbi:hypothetical protein DQ244_03700 [Blastococcus sp. TBT05-19]|uniref:hypothetical protein n=1 Tax=Blastococcus sp. TBT05-19 TaxID=2250581 RepID=UPI000DE9A5F3|nr:hypothetical protein [Blastococcus sp. TBT05-19]RBY94429.1 hypothetical protein DQ244_03700 [Blastococcus sp. TBT05-19]